jgi:dihydrolipoamide dehydrogenase
MTVMTNARFDTKAVKVTDTGVSMEVGPEGKDTATLTAEMLLVATGRAPNTENVGLETTKAELDRGFVKVDLKTMRTRVPHLYAIGDVVGGLMLAHTAGHEGLVAAHTIAGDKDVHAMDYVAQPRATYCRPEIASVGLTEQQCKDQGLPYKVGKVPFQAIAKAIIGGEYEGFAKVIGNTETGDTLGVHVIGPHATDLISEATLAFSLEATPWEIGGATHAHPTLAEIIGEAALAVDGRSINF